MDRTPSLLQLGLTLEGLATRTVVALVAIPIQVTRVADPPDQRLNRTRMARLGGPNEIVMRDVQALPHTLETGRELVHQLLRRTPLGRRFLGDLLAVLVHPDDEVHVLACQAAEAGDGVRTNLLVGVTDVRVTVGVVDGGGQVESGHGNDASVGFGEGGLRRANRAPVGHGAAWKSQSPS